MLVTYIISDIDRSLAFEWIARDVPDNDITLNFIFIGRSPGRTMELISQSGILTYFIQHEKRSGMPLTWWKLYSLLRRIKPDAVHTHMRTADLLGLSAARLAGIQMRVHTRHSSTYNHLYHPRAVENDKRISRWATHVIAISQVVRKVLTERESVPEDKVIDIPHGIETSHFQQVDENETNAIRSKYELKDEAYIVGVIARHIQWKGIQYIIPAFERFLSKEPSAVLVLANAIGPYHEAIKDLLSQLPQESYRLIPFEEDIPALYSTFDLYIHTPIDSEVEAYGQTYVEALMSGAPSIFTLSGIAHEFIRHKENAWVVPHQDSDAIFQAMESVSEDEQIRDSLIRHGRESTQQFDLPIFIDRLRTLYLQHA